MLALQFGDVILPDTFDQGQCTLRDANSWRLPLPENPTIAVHRVSGSDHDRDGRMRRAIPIKLATVAKSGTAT